MKSLTLFKGIPALRSSLKEFSITTKGDAIKFIHLRSILAAKDLGERLNEEAKNHLINNCAECEVYEAEGLAVTKIVPKVRKYTATPEIEAAQKKMDSLAAQLGEAKRELENAQNLAGFTETEGNPYFKVKT